MYLLILIFLKLSFAQNTDIKNIDIRSQMSLISKKVRELAPFIKSDSDFKKVENQKIISKNITEVRDLFSSIKNHPQIEKEGLAINQMILSEELKETLNLITKKESTRARGKFLATLNLCVSCHSQSDGRMQFKIFTDQDIKKFKLSSFDRAELYFIGRDYELAFENYAQFLNKIKKSDDDEEVLKSLERQLYYYVKVKRDFTSAKNYFEKILPKIKFNSQITKEVKDWISMLSTKPLWEKFDPKTIKEEDMEKFMARFISDEEEGPFFSGVDSTEVYDLNLSTILLDYYNEYPNTKLGGKILYWLAILEKRLNDDPYVSIGDFYLISCIEKYAKDPISKDCYEAYVEDLEINFISDKSKKFSQETEDRLQRLKKLINYEEYSKKSVTKD
jgi:hypothetical protein